MPEIIQFGKPIVSPAGKLGDELQPVTVPVTKGDMLVMAVP